MGKTRRAKRRPGRARARRSGLFEGDLMSRGLARLEGQVALPLLLREKVASFVIIL